MHCSLGHRPTSDSYSSRLLQRRFLNPSPITVVTSILSLLYTREHKFSNPLPLFQSRKGWREQRRWRHFPCCGRARLRISFCGPVRGWKVVGKGVRGRARWGLYRFLTPVAPSITRFVRCCIHGAASSGCKRGGWSRCREREKTKHSLRPP